MPLNKGWIDAALSELCVDEGCPNAGTPHVCVEAPNAIPTNTPVPGLYGPARDFVAADMARRQAELLSKYAAAMEAQISKSGHASCAPCVDLHARATLAREMSVVYFRAAELEEIK